MRRLDLNFVRRSSFLRQVSMALLMVAIVTGVYLGKVYLDRSAELASWEAKWRTLQNKQRNEMNATPDNKMEWEQLQSELKAANRVIARLSLPWDALFQEVESSVTEDITLLNVEPDTEKREVRITAETKNLGAMLDYEKRLQSIALFKHAHVVSHQIQSQDPNRPVRFVVNSQWKQ